MATDLAAGMMPQIIPIDLEFAVIIHVNKFMHERVFHMSLAEEMTLAKHYRTCLGVEATSPHRVARSAHDILRGDIAARLLQMLYHEYYRWT